MDVKALTAFIFKSGELETLLKGISGERNKLSPFSEGNGKGVSGIMLPEEKLKLRENEAFLTAAAVLCDPQFCVSAAKGGGSLDMEHFKLLGRVDEGETRWVVLLENETAVAVLYFINTAGLCEWFVDTFGVKTDLPVKNLLTSDMTLEEWIVLAHAVDSFRRAYMESMLLYRPVREYSIAARDFIASLNVAVESGDTRWLLPAFFAVTPGLSGLKPDLKPEVLQAIASKGLAGHSMNPDTHEGSFVYTTGGMTIGLEFATSWMYGVGLRASVLGDGDDSCIPACFLAPTSLGNHLFIIENKEAGTPVIRHTALTHTELDQSFSEWIGKIVDRSEYVGHHKPDEEVKTVEAASQGESSLPEAVAQKKDEASAPAASVQNIDNQSTLQATVAPVTPKQSAPEPVKQTEPIKQAPQVAPPQAQAARFCIKCGSKVTPGARFCNKCGNKMA